MTKSKAIRKRSRPRMMWTADQVEYVRANYANTPSQAIADKLGVSVRAVYMQAHSLGVSKSPAFMASEASGRMKKNFHGGKAYWFKTGRVPFNKGMKGWCAPGCEKGHFKKGDRPCSW